MGLVLCSRRARCLPSPLLRTRSPSFDRPNRKASNSFRLGSAAMGTNERSKIEMSHDEIVEYLERSRTATMVTNGPSGHPHAVAMWYAVVDGAIWFETKAKSQKATNLRRDPKITVL